LLRRARCLGGTAAPRLVTPTWIRRPPFRIVLLEIQETIKWHNYFGTVQLKIRYLDHLVSLSTGLDFLCTLFIRSCLRQVRCTLSLGLVWMGASPRQLLPPARQPSWPQAHEIEGLDELPGTGSFPRVQSKQAQFLSRQSFFFLLNVRKPITQTDQVV